MKNLKFLALLLLAVLFTVVNSQAALDTNFPSVSPMTDGVSTAFNPALGWVIGATGVLIVIGWIKKAMRK